jgi:hypothetical protein
MCGALETPTDSDCAERRCSALGREVSKSADSSEDVMSLSNATLPGRVPALDAHPSLHREKAGYRLE